MKRTIRAKDGNAWNFLFSRATTEDDSYWTVTQPHLAVECKLYAKPTN